MNCKSRDSNQQCLKRRCVECCRLTGEACQVHGVGQTLVGIFMCKEVAHRKWESRLCELQPNKLVIYKAKTRNKVLVEIPLDRNLQLRASTDASQTRVGLRFTHEKFDWAVVFGGTEVLCSDSRKQISGARNARKATRTSLGPNHQLSSGRSNRVCSRTQLSQQNHAETRLESRQPTFSGFHGLLNRGAIRLSSPQEGRQGC